MNQFREVSLTGLSDGALQEIFNRELGNVLANIQDVNTNPKSSRKIVLEIEFKPHETRDIAEVTIKANAKLAPVKEINSVVYLDSNGKALEKIEDNGAINLNAKAMY